MALVTAAVLLVWALLDRTLASLVVATAAYLGGPWSEIPFMAAGARHYVAAYADVGIDVPWLSHSSVMMMCSISHPCYFAITLNAVALRRWFQSSSRSSEPTLA